MSKKILIVDDEPDIVHAIKTVLEKNGYEVMTAMDGYEGLRIIKTNEPHLMIVDLTMPKMGGWHFSMKARQDERYKKVPIIILSGLIEHEHTPDTFEQGNVYMSKPFDVFKLLDKVKELLNEL